MRYINKYLNIVTIGKIINHVCIKRNLNITQSVVMIDD